MTIMIKNDSSSIQRCTCRPFGCVGIKTVPDSEARLDIATGTLDNMT